MNRANKILDNLSRDEKMAIAIGTTSAIALYSLYDLFSVGTILSLLSGDRDDAMRKYYDIDPDKDRKLTDEEKKKVFEKGAKDMFPGSRLAELIYGEEKGVFQFW